jgi:hypothetical protein
LSAVAAYARASGKPSSRRTDASRTFPVFHVVPKKLTDQLLVAATRVVPRRTCVSAADILARDDVDDAGYCIRTIQSGSAVRQNLDAIHALRDAGKIDEIRFRPEYG